MAVRPCLRYPDPRLLKAAAPVGGIDEAIRAIWSDMIDTMEAMPGVGLAAPQIGVALRLAVVDASRSRGEVVRMANPELVWAASEMRAEEEASPNLPGVSARVERPEEVRVRFTGMDGRSIECHFDGLWATSVQHQIDHLDGKLFVHRLSRARRDILLRRLRKRKGSYAI